MKSFARADRVGGEVKKILSSILQKKIKDPRLATVNLTGVKMTADLRLAQIYFVATGGKEIRDAALAGLQSAAGFIKRTLASELGLRYMPALKFQYDESFDYGSRIDQLLKSIHADSSSGHTPFEK